MFFPFFFWKGGKRTEQDVMNDYPYPKRIGGAYLNRDARKQLYNQQNQEIIQNQQYQPGNPPGVVVIGRVVDG